MVGDENDDVHPDLKATRPSAAGPLANCVDVRAMSLDHLAWRSSAFLIFAHEFWEPHASSLRNCCLPGDCVCVRSFSICSWCCEVLGGRTRLRECGSSCARAFLRACVVGNAVNGDGAERVEYFRFLSRCGDCDFEYAREEDASLNVFERLLFSNILGHFGCVCVRACARLLVGGWGDLNQHWALFDCSFFGQLLIVL